MAEVPQLFLKLKMQKYLSVCLYGAALFVPDKGTMNYTMFRIPGKFKNYSYMAWNSSNLLWHLGPVMTWPCLLSHFHIPGANHEPLCQDTSCTVLQPLPPSLLYLLGKQFRCSSPPPAVSKCSLCPTQGHYCNGLFAWLPPTLTLNHELAEDRARFFVSGECDNHYTMETGLIFLVSKFLAGSLWPLIVDAQQIWWSAQYHRRQCPKYSVVLYNMHPLCSPRLIK